MYQSFKHPHQIQYPCFCNGNLSVSGRYSHRIPHLVDGQALNVNGRAEGSHKTKIIKLNLAAYSLLPNKIILFAHINVNHNNETDSAHKKNRLRVKLCVLKMGKSWFEFRQKSSGFTYYFFFRFTVTATVVRQYCKRQNAYLNLCGIIAAIKWILRNANTPKGTESQFRNGKISRWV